MFSISKKLTAALIFGLLFMNACGVLDGPSDADLTAVAKKVLAKQLDSGNMDTAAKKELQTSLDALTATKKGICNVQKEVYNCAADVTIKPPGAKEAETRTVIVPLKKGNNGWEYAE